MNRTRAILAGALVWLCIVMAFTGLSYIPTLKGSLDAQAMIMAILVVPFAAWGASVYYKGNRKTNGLAVGLLMAVTALVLDALITVPLMEIPNGRTYRSFFTYPLLWVLVAVNITTVYMYWRLKLRKGK